MYLDFAGSGLYGRSQVDRWQELLAAGPVHGNPHSASRASQRSTLLMERAREVVLEFVNASPDEYCVVFTQNATAAIRLVMEAFRGDLLLTQDNHNSVNGGREFARARRDRRLVVRLGDDLRIPPDEMRAALDSLGDGSGLVAFPAQSNFSGVQHDLSWVAVARARGWHVLLDAAAYAPTNPIDLCAIRPDFVPLSFYKVCGLPTGVGCLVARREALATLRRPAFSGGTIRAVSVLGDWHVLAEGAEGFEDGTPNFLDIPAVSIGLDYLAGIGMGSIRTRTRCLTDWLLGRMLELRHRRGEPLIRIYGPAGTAGRGPTIALNLLDPSGRVVDERIVERRANEWEIALRTGCFCNPGCGEAALGLPEDRLRSSYLGGRIVSMDAYLDELALPSAGAVRISLGHVSSFADAERFLDFAATFRDQVPDPSGLPPRTRC